MSDPRPPERPPEPDLDAQIRAVELRLIDREEALRRRTRSFVVRLRHRLRPTRLALPLLGVIAAGAAIGWGVHALRRARAPRPDRPRAPRRGSWLAGLPRSSLLGLFWPMVPPRWRARVSPATVTAALSFVMPLAHGLFGRRDDAPGP